MARPVQVKVLEIRPNGVLVRILDDNRVGFIRLRELSWDRSVRTVPSTLKMGDQFEAKVIRGRRGARYVYLSRRQLTDPWREAKEKYRQGQIVRGEVVNVRHFGVFVQIEPGIDAIVWPKDIPLLRGQHLEDVLSVGDQVQGVITDINHRKRQIEISLIKRLRELSIVSAEGRKSIQLDLFRDNLHPSEPESVQHEVPASADDKAPLRRYRPPIPRLERILIIDDDEADLLEICRHLKREFQVKVDMARSGAEATDKIRRGLPYSLAVIDIRLTQEYGVQVAEELVSLKPDLAVILTSAAPLLEEEPPKVGGRKFPFAVKDAEDIAEWIDKLCNGYWEEVREPDAFAYTSGNFVRELGIAAFARRSLPEVLQQMLDRLRKETQASQSMVLEVDPTSKAVSLVATDPPIDEHIQKVSLDRLYYSPVREVVEDEEEFHETDININRYHPRLKNFFPLLDFKSCLGIPLTIPGFVTRHVLFLLNEHKERFEIEELDRARLAAKFMEAALERALLLDCMRRYEQRYALGQLLGSLVHELSNKLDGLGGQVESLPTILQYAKTSIEATDGSKWLTEANEVAEEISRAKEELDELVQAYSRMVSGDLEPVDVNSVVRKVKLQLETEARDAGVEIHLIEQDDLPPVRAIPSRLEQIVLNLVLNAIQQINRQRRSMAQIAREKDEDTALLQWGQIIVQTRCNEQAFYPIQIVVIDTGPGIHYYQQERIFLMDISTREKGHGLGLFISRNLAETMGGRIRLADSLMFIGSVFVVELPLFSGDGG